MIVRIIQNLINEGYIIKIELKMTELNSIYFLKTLELKNTTPSLKPKSTEVTLHLFPDLTPQGASQGPFPLPAKIFVATIKAEPTNLEKDNHPRFAITYLPILYQALYPKIVPQGDLFALITRDIAYLSALDLALWPWIIHDPKDKLSLEKWQNCYSSSQSELIHCHAISYFF